MALINCSKCGKKVSDKAEKCIHCGATLKEEKVELLKKEEKQVTKVENKKNVIKFFSLNRENQTRLEQEFISTDVKLMKFKRREIELVKFSHLGNCFINFGFFCFLGLSLIITFLLNGEIYRANIVSIGGILLLVSMGLGVLIKIYNLISKIMIKTSSKKLIYLKKFEKWLKDNKEIEYSTVAMTSREKEIFEKIDLEITNL